MSAAAEPSAEQVHELLNATIAAQEQRVRTPREWDRLAKRVHEANKIDCAFLRALQPVETSQVRHVLLGPFSVAQLWRMRRVCRDFRNWCADKLVRLPKTVAHGQCFEQLLEPLNDVHWPTKGTAAAPAEPYELDVSSESDEEDDGPELAPAGTAPKWLCTMDTSSLSFTATRVEFRLTYQVISTGVGLARKYLGNVGSERIVCSCVGIEGALTTFVGKGAGLIDHPGSHPAAEFIQPTKNIQVGLRFLPPFTSGPPPSFTVAAASAASAASSSSSGCLNAVLNLRARSACWRWQLAYVWSPRQETHCADNLLGQTMTGVVHDQNGSFRPIKMVCRAPVRCRLVKTHVGWDQSSVRCTF